MQGVLARSCHSNLQLRLNTCAMDRNFQLVNVTATSGQWCVLSVCLVFRLRERELLQTTCIVRAHLFESYFCSHCEGPSLKEGAQTCQFV